MSGSTCSSSLGVDKVALSEASALDLHQSAAIPVHAMTVKKAMENYGWEDQLPRRGRGDGCARAPT